MCIRDRSKAREKEGLSGIRKLTKPLLENYTYAKIKVCDVSEAERGAFAKQSQGVWKKFTSKSKGNKKLFDAVMAAKKKYKAGK